MKKRNGITKHDIKRSIQSIYTQLQFVTERLRITETLLNDFIEMQKLDDKFNKYLDGKYDFIGKIEKMEESFKNLIKEINVDFYPEFKIGGTKNLDFYSSMYKNQETIDKVTEIYSQDIDRFDYAFLDWENK